MPPPTPSRGEAEGSRRICRRHPGASHRCHWRCLPSPQIQPLSRHQRAFRVRSQSPPRDVRLPVSPGCQVAAIRLRYSRDLSPRKAAQKLVTCRVRSIARLSGLSRSPRIVTTVHCLPPAVDGADISHWSRHYFKKWLKCIALFQSPVSPGCQIKSTPAAIACAIAIASCRYRVSNHFRQSGPRSGIGCTQSVHLSGCFVIV